MTNINNGSVDISTIHESVTEIILNEEHSKHLRKKSIEYKSKCKINLQLFNDCVRNGQTIVNYQLNECLGDHLYRECFTLFYTFYQPVELPHL